ncbi:MAG: GIY-YIG nuclease family protein [Chlorobiales bacterium]|nr:GIY-YIG nuclease family protein [Chlorobiales bacterium]
MYYVYVLKSRKDNRFYIGYTADLERRITEHSKGLSRATAHRRPLDLVYYEACRTSRDGIRREKYLKTTYGHRYLKNRIRNDDDGSGKA